MMGSFTPPPPPHKVTVGNRSTLPKYQSTKVIWPKGDKEKEATKLESKYAIEKSKHQLWTAVMFVRRDSSNNSDGCRDHHDECVQKQPYYSTTTMTAATTTTTTTVLSPQLQCCDRLSDTQLVLSVPNITRRQRTHLHNHNHHIHHTHAHLGRHHRRFQQQKHLPHPVHNNLSIATKCESVPLNQSQSPSSLSPSTSLIVTRSTSQLKNSGSSNRQKHRIHTGATMSTQSAWRHRWLNIGFLVLIYAVATTLGQAFSCPPVNLIHRLTVPNGKPLNHYAQALNMTPECDCTSLQEGGWEINCYSSSAENDESKTKWTTASGSREFDSVDYPLDYNVLTVSFSVRYEMGKYLKITCDQGAPVFKPALFQGFGVESIDTFHINNCELPLTLPLSVILYRTIPKHVFSISSRFGDSSYSINSTTDSPNEISAPIRSLSLTSSKPVSIQQLNTLLSDLESLEQLTLNDFNLNDVDDFIVETVDKHLGVEIKTSDEVSSFHHRRRVTRAANSQPVTEPTFADNVDVETTTIADNDDHFGTTLPYEPLTDIANVSAVSSNVSVNVTTTSMIEESNETVTMMPMVSFTNATTPGTTSSTTPNNSTESLNSTRTGKESTNIAISAASVVTNVSVSTVSPTMPSVVTEEADNNVNDVNVENKPIVMFDENVLNFSGILPNLRVLRLREFIKESNIPGVLFQIIQGLQKLETLQLTSNNISQIPKHALAAAGAHLKVLYLYQNSISHIHELAFFNLSRLEILDLSQNRLTTLQDYTFKPLKNLLYLSLKNNQLQLLSELVFQANTKLVSLDLSRNSQLKPLPSNMFSGLQKLANFSLAYCNMSTVSDQPLQLFRNLPSLSKLELRDNQLENLTINGLFAWNGKLNKLDLASNRISAISGAIFSTNSSQITEINLNVNRLTNLPENLFVHVRNLRKLSVAHNELRELVPSMYIHLRQLEELNLSRNKISTLNTHVNQLPFGIGGSLKRVNLSYNNLTDFEADINAVNWNLYLLLSELNLKGNHFSGILKVPVFSASIEPDIEMDVSSNHFTGVDVKMLAIDWDLKHFEHTSTDVFSEATVSGQSWETHVRLDNNPIQCDCRLFDFLNYTKTTGQLFSKHSHSITRKTIFIMDTTNQLTCAQPEPLMNRSLNQLQLNQLVCHIEDDRVCPQDCHCLYRAVDQAAIVDCDNSALQVLPEELQLSRFYNISVRELNEPISKVESVIVQLRNNSLNSLATLPDLFIWFESELTKKYMLKPNYVDVFLDHNNITTIERDLIPQPDGPYLMSLIRTLSLRENAIQHVPLDVLVNFEAQAARHGLASRNVTDNTIAKRMISSSTIWSNRAVQSKIYLGKNPIDCGNQPMSPETECYIREFKRWLSTHPDRVGDLTDIRCDRKSFDLYAQKLNETDQSLVLVDMNENLLCPVLIPPAHNGTLLVLSMVCIVLASSLFVVSVLYYRNKQTFLAFIYIHLNPIFICLSFSEDDLDEDKIYDAFVSYSSSDRDIVMELIEKLEKPHDMTEANLMLQNGSTIHEGKIDRIVPENEYKNLTLKSSDVEASGAVGDGESRYRLCIHERDWLPGNLISWNIVNSVQNSKRTILVLSQQFIQSIWFQVEFHTAYYQMLEDKMDRLIVIVRGELPPRDQLDKDLNFLLTTKTYLVWGEKWFWEKLYYAMPHKKNHSLTKFSKETKAAEKRPITASINGKSNGALNGGVNGSVHKHDGMLKWSSSYQNSKSPKNAKAEAMKEYVDKTIASHFQLSPLNTSTTTTTNSEDNNSVQSAKPSYGTTAAEPKPPARSAPKSLRNSGTLSTASRATLQAFNTNGGTTNRINNAAYDNKSFIKETNT